MRSLRDKVASAYGLDIKLRREMATASTKPGEPHFSWSLLTSRYNQQSSYLLLGILLYACMGSYTHLIVVTHYALSGMIIRSKMAKLTALQEFIDRTERETNMADKGAVENITQLMDYHDRIKAYPNSLVNGRTVINLITS